MIIIIIIIIIFGIASCSKGSAQIYAR